MADVFLSYARVDREVAERVKAGLEAAGLSVFFDVEGLDGGDVFPDVLDREVKGAGAVISLWSPHSLSRPWVKQECSIGLKRKCLIPLAIAPLGDLDVPVAFEGLQQIDFTGFHGRTDTAEWQKLMRSLARTLGRPELVAAPAAAAARPIQVRAPASNPDSVAKRGLPWPVYLVGNLLLAGVLVFAAFYFVRPPTDEAPANEAATEAAPEAAPAAIAEAPAVAEFIPPPAGLTEPQPGVPCGDLKALVYFDFDRTDLKAETQSILEEALTRGFDCDLVEVRIEAHDDLINSPSYAEGVSQRRASAIAEFLTVRGGVNSESITSIGFGSSQPLQPGERTPANRRAEILFDFEAVTPAADSVQP
jgi:outer membrane protein OmpA-like peptidoglycan-associated protein